MKRPTAKPARSKSKSSTPQLEATEHKGDLLIRDLWHNGTDSVHDMRIMNTDDNSYLAKIPEKCLQEAQQAKKKMYLEAYHQQRRHVLPFVAFVDELLSVEASANLKRIASRLTKKWRQPYYRNADESILELLSLWCGPHTSASEGSRVLTHNISAQGPQW